MQLARHNLNQSGTPAAPRRAFTLIEMLVVLGIIGILAAMTLPSFKSAGKGNVLESAMRQLQDDLAQARLKAISSRSKVYVVFAPDYNWYGPLPGSNQFVLTNFSDANAGLIGGQLTSYAIYSPRFVGDQPGRNTPRYLSEWHSLPNGAFFPNGMFYQPGLLHNIVGSPLAGTNILVSEATNQTLFLPFVAFDEQGRLFGRATNIAIPIVEGGLFIQKDSTGQTNLLVPVGPDAVETVAPVPQTGGIVPGIEYLVLGPAGSQVRYPPGGGGTNYVPGTSFTGSTLSANFTPTGSPRVVHFYGVRIDALSGRARAVRPEIQ